MEGTGLINFDLSVVRITRGNEGNKRRIVKGETVRYIKQMTDQEGDFTVLPKREHGKEKVTRL